MAVLAELDHKVVEQLRLGTAEFHVASLARPIGNERKPARFDPWASSAVCSMPLPCSSSTSTNRGGSGPGEPVNVMST